MTKKKTPHSTKGKKPVQQSRPYWDEYFNLKMFDRTPIYEETLITWAKDLRTWVTTHPDPRYESEFYRSIPMYKNEWKRLCAKYPILGNAREEALQIIGENLYRRSVDQKANWQAVKHSLYRHDDDFAKDDAHAAEIKEAGNPNTPINLHFPAVPTSDEVPHKPTKEKEE